MQVEDLDELIADIEGEGIPGGLSCFFSFFCSPKKKEKSASRVIVSFVELTKNAFQLSRENSCLSGN